MGSRKSRLLWQVLSATLFTFLFVFPALSQDDDPNPNSPTPILISENDSTRALTNELGVSNGKSRQTQSKAFRYESKVRLYLTNVDLMEGEEADAFRVYAEDAKGRKYRFPVLDLQPLKGQEWIYSITVLLKDEIGYWDQPEANGDIAINLTWRGLVSNTVKLGLGRTGGDLNEESGAVPTPLKDFATKPEKISTPTEEYVGYRYSGDRIRLLEQATFGPTTTLDQRIRRIGLRIWLNEQLNAQYPSVGNPYPDFPLKNGDTAVGCPATLPTEERRICIRDHYSQYPLQKWFFTEALYGEPQLKHKVAWALSQIWVTSGASIQQSSHMIAYHKILSNNAFGNYRDLMKEMTLNPAMGEYLDMARSTRNNPNENYPREILQLFTVGLFMLNDNGTLKLSNGQPIETYDQTTVNNFTKVFTGWTFCNNGTNPACPSAVVNTTNYKDPMYLITPNNHDQTAKTLFNYSGAPNPTIAACTNCTTDDNRRIYANDSLNKTLDNIFYHPNVPPFVSRLLIQHLVTSDPTPAYVGRVTEVFKNNGFGVRGDLKAVVRAILLDPEARGDVKTSPTYGKLREPVQFLTNILRQFNVRSASGTGLSDGVISGTPSGIGQNPFYSPTVFNYYSPDYVIPGTALNGPEFNLMTTGTSIGRANVGNTFAFSRINTSADAPNGTAIDLSEMTQLAQNDPTGNQMMDALNVRLMHGTMSTQMRNTILTAVTAVPATTPQARAQQAIYLVVTSSQYQVQR
jgi:uncharacterized protein (DUF1800 family)